MSTSRVVAWGERSDDAGGDFYLVGAGFSRAISEHMPAMTQLRDLMLSELHLEQSHLSAFTGDLELWLTHLGSDQPWLDEAQKLRNRAVFIEASYAIETAIEKAETLSTQDASPPPWLLRLAYAWRADRSIIATLNYDLLIERAVRYLGGAGTYSDLYGMSLDSRVAPGDIAGQYSVEPPKFGLPTLFKLHGSLNWLYSGDAGSSTDRVVLRAGLDQWQSISTAEKRVVNGRRAYIYDGLVPLVVPPTSTKNLYYRNQSLQAQWRRAAQRLAVASRLIIVGYSFPPSDIQLRQFVATSLEGKTPVTVVDFSETKPADIALLIGRDGVESYVGPSAVQTFVEENTPTIVQCFVLPGVDRDRWEPRGQLTVNGDIVYTSGPGDNQTQLFLDARAEAERRWPGITDQFREDRSRQAGRLAAEVALIRPGDEPPAVPATRPIAVCR